MEINKYFDILSGEQDPTFLDDRLKTPDVVRLKNINRVNILSGSRKGQFIKSSISRICDISGYTIPAQIQPPFWNEDKNNDKYIIPSLIPALKAGVAKKGDSVFSNEINIATDVETKIEGIGTIKRHINPVQKERIFSRLFDILGSDQKVRTNVHVAGLLNIEDNLVGATISPEYNFLISSLSEDEIVSYLNSLSKTQVQRAPGGILWPHPIISSHIEEINGVNRNSPEFEMQYIALLKILLGIPPELVQLTQFLDKQGCTYSDKANNLFNFLNLNSLKLIDENQSLLGNWIELLNIDGKKYILRGITPSDYDQLSKIAINNFLEAPNYIYLHQPGHQDELAKYIKANSPEGIADLCNKPNNMCNLVIEHDGHIVGFRVARKNNDIADGRRMHTSLEYTDKGIGSILLTKSEQIAKQTGCAKMEIHATGGSNSWFEKKGYTDQGIKPNGISQFHLMVKNL